MTEAYVGDIQTDDHTVVKLSTRPYSENKSAKALGVDGKAVRAWAKANGLVTAGKGRMHQSVIRAYIDSMGS